MNAFGIFCPKRPEGSERYDEKTAFGSVEGVPLVKEFVVTLNASDTEPVVCGFEGGNCPSEAYVGPG